MQASSTQPAPRKLRILEAWASSPCTIIFELLFRVYRLRFLVSLNFLAISPGSWINQT